MDDHSSRQLGEELNQLFSKWQENFQPLEPHLSTFQEIADSVAELANDGADSSIFSTQQVTTGPLEEELVAENLWRPMEEQGTKSLIELGPGVDSITSSHLEKLQRNDERILSNCAVDKFCESLIDIASREVEHRSSCLATFDVHNLSVDSSSRPSHSAFGTEDSHYLSYLLFLNRRKLQAVEDCLEKIDSIQKLDTLSQQQKNNGSSVSHGSRTSMPWYWSWIRTNSQKNAVHSLEHPPYTTALFKYANYFIQRLGFSSSNLFKGYVPFCGVEIVKKGRREVLEPKRHSDTERVGSQKRKELGISFEKSFRPRNFQQVLEKMVIRSAQEERYQELVDELTKGVIGHHEFRNKIKEISEMSLLDASYQSVHWSREKWVGLLEQNTSKLSKNVQVDDVRLYWVNYGASFYRKDSFSKEEDEEILQAVQQLGEHSWVQVANRVNSGRSPWQYFCRYQRTLRPTCLTCKWTMEEDMKLLAAIEKYGTKQWSLVSCNVPGRTRQQCLHRWRRGLCPNIHHGKWTVEEDELLRKAVVKYGEGHWSQIAQMVPGRTDLQCRERYTDVLKPSLSHQPWTHEENERLLQLTQEMGTGKWSLVASFMKNRTDNQCYRQYKKLKSETRKKQKRSNSDGE